MANRIEALCESLIHGLEIMEYTVDDMVAFITFAIVHGLIIKGVKVLIKFWYVPLAYAVIVLYSIFKVIDAIFIHYREMKNAYADPKKHCRYVQESYTDRWMAWLKQARAVDTVLSDRKSKS